MRNSSFEVSYAMKHRVRHAVAFLLVAVCITALASCGKKDTNRKETIPVTGEVYVDGKPAAMLQITCYPVTGMDKEQPTITQAVTDKDGKFKLSTYEEGDGAPVGEYKLTFVWQKFDAFAARYSGPDKLGGRYSDPNSSQVTLKVEKGKPIDMGRIELSSK